MKLRGFPIVDTHSRDEMRDALINVYGAIDFDARRDQERFRGVGNVFRGKHFDLCYCHYSADASATFTANELVKQPFGLSGSGSVTFGAAQLNVGVNQGGVIPAGIDVTCNFAGNFSQLVLRLSVTSIHRKLAAMIGRPIGKDIVFSTSATPQNPGQAQLRRIVEFLVSEIDREEAVFPELALADFEQMIMVSFLAANDHNFSHLLRGKLPSAGPWQVRIVEEYIEANWSRPITIEALAEATGVGVRSIFKTFKEARGYSPMAFLKRIRLEQARRMLRMPDDSTSVTAIALYCGFNNSGHFAREYREAFDELPSATLATAKRGLRRAGSSQP